MGPRQKAKDPLELRLNHLALEPSTTKMTQTPPPAPRLHTRGQSPQMTVIIITVPLIVMSSYVLYKRLALPSPREKLEQRKNIAATSKSKPEGH
ncbi:hypothetical protein BKA62DRAFT_834076 [Auriculariales sp. MPI-PUGE-AT-0066]|nr:hypothetical protein BKA62DRAFT_834076 [Auriculariales sp. MPI-PUGE-AT-0066]